MTRFLALAAIPFLLAGPRPASADDAFKGYYVVLRNLVHDDGQTYYVPGFAELAHRLTLADCQQTAESMRKSHFVHNGNPFVTVIYECWPAAKVWQATVRASQCRAWGVHCDG